MAQPTGLFIDAVRAHPVLYDTTHGEHKNSRAKSKAWEAVADRLGENVDVVKSRWKNLRDSYSKHLRALRPARAKYCERYRTWPWVQHMGFLRPHVEPELGKRGREPALFPLELAPVEDSKPEEEPSEEPEFLEESEPRPHRAQALGPQLGELDDTDLVFLGHARALRRLSRARQALAKFKVAEVIMDAELAQAQDDAA